MTKYKAPSDKTDKKSSSAHRSGDSADSSAAAQTPPTYGIDLADSAPVQKIPLGKRPSTDAKAAPTDKQPHNGLPDNLKAGIESLSGYAMDDVKVHYNSTKPAQLQAHAYAQGTDIHLAPGQERHLPHEAWHVVQQKQGRVPSTTQFKGLPGNDDARLENEADRMGAKALHSPSDTGEQQLSGSKAFHSPQGIASAHKPRIQRKRKGIGETITGLFKTKKDEDEDITLDDIMNDRYAVPYLRQFLVTQMSPESLDFIMAVRSLYPQEYGNPSYDVQDVTTPQIYESIFLQGITHQSVYDQFIKEENDVFYGKINISGDQKAEIGEAIHNNDYAAIRGAYRTAYNEMVNIIRYGLFINFLGSEDFFEPAKKALKPSRREKKKRKQGQVIPTSLNYDLENML